VNVSTKPTDTISSLIQKVTPAAAAHRLSSWGRAARPSLLDGSDSAPLHQSLTRTRPTAGDRLRPDRLCEPGDVQVQRARHLSSAAQAAPRPDDSQRVGGHGQAGALW